MKLPSVFANKIDNRIENNISCYHGDRHKDKRDLRRLKEMFDNKGYVNRLGVKLEMKDGLIKDEKLVLCKNSYFVNLNNEKIYFDDIVDYEIKK